MASASSPSSKTENVRVFARFRPLSEEEEKHGDLDTLTVSSDGTPSPPTSSSSLSSNTIPYSNDETLNKYHPLIINPDGELKQVKVGASTYTFHEVFGVKTPQTNVHARAIAPLIDHICNGFNVSVIAYGQSGSGKTHTMYGPEEDPGLVFAMLRSLSEVRQIITRELKVSVMELYNGYLYDLYSADVLTRKASDSAIQRAISRVCKDIRWYNVSSFGEIEDILAITQQRRTVAETKLNRHSSRGHLLLSIQIPLSCKDNKGTKMLATVKMVDLCGSENVGKSGATGDVFKEAVSINTSLFHLRLAVQQIVEKARVVAYNNDPLTKFLKDSLGGNSLTSVIVCCSPSKIHRRETANTLVFGSSMQNVKNSLQANKVLTHEEALRQLAAAKERIAGLQAIIANLKFLLKQNGIEIGSATELSDAMIADGTESVRSMASTADNQPESRPVSGLMDTLFGANESKLEQATQAIAREMETSVTPVVVHPEPMNSVDKCASPTPMVTERKDCQTQTDYVPMTYRAPALTQTVQGTISIPPKEQLNQAPLDSAVISLPPPFSLPPPLAFQPSITSLTDRSLVVNVPPLSEELIETHALPFPPESTNSKQKRARQYYTMDSAKLQQLLAATTGNEKTAAAVSLATSEEWKTMVDQLKRAKQHGKPAAITLPIRKQQSQIGDDDGEPLLPQNQEEAKKILRAIYRRIATLTRDNL